mgnify:CR=1 FL=1|tara:strand:- start:3372 stop:6419 length:3048 start_codon:yes stop_codon:yes gene_type:complete
MSKQISDVSHRIRILVIFLFQGLLVYSQASIDTNLRFPFYHLIKINSEDGLPSNEILDLHFSRDKFLWILTRSGLVRFDGRKFIPIESVSGQKIQKYDLPWLYNLMDHSTVFPHSKNGMIEIDSMGLGLKIRPFTKEFSFGNRGAYSKTRKNRSYSLNMIPPNDSSYYCGLESGYLGFKQGDQIMPLKIKNTEPRLRALRTFEIEGRVFNLTTDGFLLELVVDRVDTLFKWPNFNLESEERFPSQIIWKYRSKYCFIFQNGVLFRLSIQDTDLHIQPVAKNLPNYVYQTAQYNEDSELLFLGTRRNGLIQIYKSSIRQVSVLDFCPVNFDNYALVEIGKDSIMNSSGVLFHNNKADCALEFHTEFHPRTLFYDEENQRIYGSTSSGLAYYSKQELRKKLAPTILPGVKGPCKTIIKHRSKIFFTIGGIGLCVLKKDSVKIVLKIPELTNFHTHQLKAVSDSILFVAGDFGLIQINLNQNNYQIIQCPKNSEVTSISFWNDDYWITTLGKGIFIKNKGIWHSFKPNLFPDLENCHEIKFMGDKVFLPTNSGLFAFNIADVYANCQGKEEVIKAYTFGKEDGLFFYEFNGRSQNASIHTEDDKLIFPNLNGIVVFHNELFFDQESSEKVFLEYLILNKRDTISKADLYLPYNFQSLHAKITHPFYGRSRDSKLFYRIPEISENWNSFNPNDPIRIDRLAWGSYTLQLNIPGVKSANSRIQNLFEFNISPPFYYTKTFLLVLLLFLIGLISILFIRTKKKAKQRQIELEKIIKERTDSLAKSKKNVERALRIRDKMITVFSHDIRGPLAFFKRIVSEAQEKAVRWNYEKIEQDLNELYMSSESSYETANSLIKWIEGQINPQRELREMVELEELVLSVLLNKSVEIKKLNLEVDFSISEQCKFLFEKGGLKIILNNIIQNSIKYTNGMISIKGEVFQSKVHIVLEDDGGGIQDPNVLYKLNIGGTVQSRLGKNGQVGAGLGLFMVREIVQRNHGSIQFKNYSQGLRVTIILPLESDYS